MLILSQGCSTPLREYYPPNLNFIILILKKNENIGCKVETWSQVLIQGGTQNKRPYGGVPPRGVLTCIHTEIWVPFGQKIFRRGSHITKIAKNGKISHFCGRKTLRNGSRGFAKILKNKTKQNKTKKTTTTTKRRISRFWGRKTVS